MSFRRLTTTADAGVQLWRSVLDRLERLEKGSANAGLVSFEEIRVGDVVISTTVGAGMHRNLVFTNIVSGATHVVPL